MPKKPEAAPGLTLQAGALPAAFKPLTLLGRIEADERADRAAQALRKEFADLLKQEGDAYLDHADRPAFEVRHAWRARRFPYLIAAWAGEGALTTDAIEASTDAEMHACMAEVRRLNPHLIQFPAGPAPGEDADPNA